MRCRQQHRRPRGRCPSEADGIAGDRAILRAVAAGERCDEHARESERGKRKDAADHRDHHTDLASRVPCHRGCKRSRATLSRSLAPVRMPLISRRVQRPAHRVDRSGHWCRRQQLRSRPGNNYARDATADPRRNLNPLPACPIAGVGTMPAHERDPAGALGAMKVQSYDLARACSLV
jgi:hypothetical protein